MDNERRSFSFEFGGLVVTGESDDAQGWASRGRRMQLWRFARDGAEVARRRCGLPLAVETAFLVGQGRWLYDRLTQEEWAAVYDGARAAEVELEKLSAECAREIGDPNVSPLAPLDETAADIGVLYCIDARDKYKIGFTRVGGLDQRLRSLQTGSPVKLKVAFTVRGTMAEERLLHRRFRHLRSHGEWFHKRTEIGRAFCLMIVERGSAE